MCENRPEVLDNFAAELKPGVTLLRQFPAKFIEDGGCHANTAVVALTHDPRMDDLTLMEAIHTPAFYIGAMGSLRNSARRRQRLQQIAEFTPQELERIHAPIGLPLGSKTPAEIAGGDGGNRAAKPAAGHRRDQCNGTTGTRCCSSRCSSSFPLSE